MCVCVYLCTHMCACVCMCTRARACILCMCVCMCVSVSTCVCVHDPVCPCMHMYCVITCMCTCECVNMCVCICMCIQRFLSCHLLLVFSLLFEAGFLSERGAQCFGSLTVCLASPPQGGDFRSVLPCLVFFRWVLGPEHCLSSSSGRTLPFELHPQVSHAPRSHTPRS